jgi:acyl-CoA thioesterase FadM
MSKNTVFEIKVQFGDCDPAGIVFFPNFSKWMDASSLHFFMECGVPPWRELVKTTGIIGTPLLEIHTKFMRPATYGPARRRAVVRRPGDTCLRDSPARRSASHQGDSGA